MRNIIIIALILILPVVAYLTLDSRKGSTIISEAQAGDKPVVMIFSSPMCGECVKMKKIIDEVEPKYSGKIEFSKINAQDGDAQIQSMVKKYKITLVPTMVFLNKSGGLVTQHEGYMPKDKFENELKGLL